MKERTMKKVFKGVAILFGGMFLYGVITIGAMIAKYGLHFGYVSDGSIELIGGLITIAVILGASMAGGTPSRSFDGSWRVSTDEMTEDNTEEDIFDGIYHDTSSYYMAVNDF